VNGRRDWCFAATAIVVHSFVVVHYCRALHHLPCLFANYNYNDNNNYPSIMEAVQQLAPYQQQEFVKEMEKLQLKDSLT
jgi:hypothetical protein